MSTTAASFYVIGGTLQRDAACYVPRKADVALEAGLKEGRFCYVLTSRQMGKSSLMVRTATRLRAEGVAVVVLDLTAIGQNLTAEQWYDGLLGRVGQQLDLEDELEDFWLDHERLAPLQRWLRALREVVLVKRTNRVVLFVDEIDAVRSLPFSTDEFFSGIREFYNRRTEDAELSRLTFCLLGVATPSDLIRDTRTTPFNIGQRIELKDFTETEALPLAQGLGPDKHLGQLLLNRIIYWTGGHPYLTQRLCQAVAVEQDRNITIANDVANNVAKSVANDVDRICEELFLSTRSRECDDNLLFVRERILRSEVDLPSLLELYGKVRSNRRVRDDDTNSLVTILRLSGITRVDDGVLKVRNRIYQHVFDPEWVSSNMPDAEKRRLQRAKRRGVLLGLLPPMALLALVILFAFSLKNQSDSTRRLLYVARINLAQQAWEQGSIPRVEQLLQDKIEANNIFINILDKLVGQEDLHGFEWYYYWHLCHSTDKFTLHDDALIFSLAYSPDGEMLAAGRIDSRIRVWDVATRQERISLKLDKGMIGSVAYSPDGRLLAAGSGPFPNETGAGIATLWDSHSGKTIATLTGHQALVGSVAFSPDGKKLATGSCDRTAKIWDIETGKELFTLSGHKDWIYSVAFSPDSKILATASRDSSIKLWDTTTGQQLATLEGHTKGVCTIKFSPDGKTLASGSWDYAVKLWDIATRREIANLKGHNDGVWSVAFSPDGKQLATGSYDFTIKIWDIATRQDLKTLKGHTNYVNSVVFSPDGKTLASGSNDQTIKFWDTGVEQEATTLRGHTDRVHAVAFSPDNHLIASGSLDGSAKLWDAATGKEIATFNGRDNPPDQVFAVAFSPDGKLLAVGGGAPDNNIWPGIIKIWDIKTKQEIATFKGHANRVTSLAFSPDGSLLASGSRDSLIKLWSIVEKREIATLKGHRADIVSLAFSPDGKILAAGGGPYMVVIFEPGSVKLWNVETGAELATLEGHTGQVTSVAFSPDGRQLATGSDDKTAKIWDIAKHKELLTLRGHTSEIQSVAFSPDGKRLATSSKEATVKLWSLATGQELITFTGHKGTISSVVFSPDGKTMATASYDKTVRLWHADHEQSSIDK